MIIEKLREYITETLEVSTEVMNDLKDTDLLIEKEILDSVTTIKFLVFIEKAFNIKLDLNAIGKKEFSTLSNIEKLIRCNS